MERKCGDVIAISMHTMIFADEQILVAGFECAVDYMMRKYTEIHNKVNSKHTN